MNEEPRSVMANKFIELANEFALTEPKERVSAAILFAASRYNAFEASGKSKNLSKDKPDVMTWFVSEYSRMLDTNLDELIEMH